jgi:5-hydroxyisourate hydrolase
MGLSTHILDTALGKPAAGVAVTLWQRTSAGFHQLVNAQTDADGRCKSLRGDGELKAGIYRLTFFTAKYFTDQRIIPLYPYVEIVFDVVDPSQHYHIPLLLAANGYTTYRGS